MNAWLELGQGKRTALTGTCTIGRLEENTVALDDPKVSRRHALVHLHDSGCWLVDFGSRNGVFLNGQRVGEPALLKNGDRVIIGEQELCFHQTGEAHSPSAAPGRAKHLESTEHHGENFTETGAGIVILNPALVVTYATDHAQRWLKDYAADQAIPPEGLPPDVMKWLRAELAAHKPEQRPAPLTLSKQGKRLVLRIAERNADQVVLMLAEEVPAYSPERLAKLGLTERESEVLHWIIQGKSNPEIAIILGLSPRTVGSHVEHILEKLGVENRATAVFTAVERLG